MMKDAYLLFILLALFCAFPLTGMAQEEKSPENPDPLEEHKMPFKQAGADAGSLAISADKLIKSGEQEWLRKALLDEKTTETGALAIISAFTVNKDISALPEILLLSHDSAKQEVQSRCRKAVAAFLEDEATHAQSVKWLRDSLGKEPGSDTMTLAVVGALGEARDLTTVQDLIGLVDRGDEKVREGAIQSLKMLTYHDFGADGKAWQEWWDGHKHLSRDRIIEPILMNRIKNYGEQIENLKKQRMELAFQIIDGNPDQALAFLKWDEPKIRQRAAKVISEDESEERSEEKMERVLAHLEEGESDGETLKLLLKWIGSQKEKPAAAQKILLSYLSNDPRDSIKIVAAKSLEGFRTQEVRDAAAEILNQVKEDKSRDGLVEQLLDLLAAVGSGPDLELITEFLKPQYNKGVREKAVKALGASDNEDAIRLLGETLVNEPETDIRFEVANGLRRLGKSEKNEEERKAKAVATLKRGLLDRESRVRMACINGIGELEPPDAFAILSEHLRSESDPEVRKWCIMALGWIRDPRGLEVICNSLPQNNKEDPANKKIFEKAQSAVDEICGDQPELWNQAGNLFLRESRYELAFMCFTTYIDKAKSTNVGEEALRQAKIYQAEASVMHHLESSDYAKALEQMTTLLELAPETRKYVLIHARILSGLDRKPEAKEEYLRYLAMIPADQTVESCAAKWEIAELLLGLDDAAGAREMLQGIDAAAMGALSEDLKTRIAATLDKAKAMEEPVEPPAEEEPPAVDESQNTEPAPAPAPGTEEPETQKPEDVPPGDAGSKGGEG